MSSCEAQTEAEGNSISQKKTKLSTDEFDLSQTFEEVDLCVYLSPHGSGASLQRVNKDRENNKCGS